MTIESETGWSESARSNRSLFLEETNSDKFLCFIDLNLSISLDNDQLDALFYNTSTTILYMFQALHAHHREVNCIDAAS